MKKIISYLIWIMVGLIIVLFPAVLVKGDLLPDGSLAYQQNIDTRVTGPYESSGSSSRYALVEAIAKSGTFFFSEAQARLATPDLVLHNGKYFSIFTPGVSFVVLPFYFLGSMFGIPQLVAYGATTLAAIINGWLVFFIARRLGSSVIPAVISGFLFLVGTNAMTYAFTLTQHHFSILVILLAVVAVFWGSRLWRNIILGLLYGVGILVDLPNAIIMLPLLVFVVGQHFYAATQRQKIVLKFNLTLVLIALSLLPLLYLFGWYNAEVTGNPTRPAQFVGRSDFPPKPKPVEDIKKKSKDIYAPKYPFYSRDQLNGLYILLVSNERGWLYYSPIVFIGVLGLFVELRKKIKQPVSLVLLTMVGLTIAAYSSFGDPWGGWSFGPRYLLPATALLSAGIGLALERWRRNIFFGLTFLIVAGYSIYVSALGAFTTTQVPPKQEAEHLVTFIPYTYEYNKQLIDQNKTGSLFYNLWLKGRVPLEKVVLIYQGLGIYFVLIIYAVYVKNDLFHKRPI